MPVHVRGALLWTGDSHAAQGNGEVNLTAIETAYREMNLTIDVIKGKPLDFPRIETRDVMDRHGFRSGSQQGLGPGEGAEHQAPFRAAQGSRRSGGKADDDRLGLPRVAGGQHQEGIHCLNPKNVAAREDMERPTKETAKYLVSHAKDADLNKAMDAASMGMIKLLESEKKIARLDAYGLASVAMDCRVGAISDTEKNVHCVIPKSIFVAAR